MTGSLIIQDLPPTGYITGVLNPRNEPVRIVPYFDYYRYHQERSYFDGNFCCILNGRVVAAEHYPYDHFIILTTDTFNTQFIKWKR